MIQGSVKLCSIYEDFGITSIETLCIYESATGMAYKAFKSYLHTLPKQTKYLLHGYKELGLLVRSPCII